MKKIALILVAIVLAVPCLAAPSRPGVYELRVQPSIDILDVADNEGIPFAVGLSRYVAENIHFGAMMKFAKKDYDSYWGEDDVWGLSIFAEVNLDWDAPLLPYIGIDFGLLDGDADDDTVFVTTLSPGVKAFLMETFSVSLQMDWQFAGDDIFDFDRIPSTSPDVQGSGDNSGLSLAIAARFLFF